LRKGKDNRLAAAKVPRAPKVQKLCHVFSFLLSVSRLASRSRKWTRLESITERENDREKGCGGGGPNTSAAAIGRGMSFKTAVKTFVSL